MKYKIQIQTLWGWCDLKSSVDGQEYEVETFDSIQDAQNEIDEMIDGLEDQVPETYRIVEHNVLEEINLYT